MMNDTPILNRRKHGCDGCHRQVPTEKFDGRCGNHLWICEQCRKELITNGIRKFKYENELEGDRTMKL